MNRAAFFGSLRRKDSGVFGTSLSARQVRGIEGILEAFETHGDGRAKTLAYALATAYHETAKAMMPVKETVMPYHKDKNPSDDEVVRRLDVWAAKKGRTKNIYWRPDPETGKAYFARGHVGLTWKKNYQASSVDAGVDLVTNPDAMLDPVISARVMIKGLIDGRWNARGKGVAFYLPTSGPDDLTNARRTVNITDKWQFVGGYYASFLSALMVGDWGLKSAQEALGPPLILDQEFYELENPIIRPKPNPLAQVIKSIISAFLAIFGRKPK